MSLSRLQEIRKRLAKLVTGGESRLEAADSKTEIANILCDLSDVIEELSSEEKGKAARREQREADKSETKQG